MVILSSMWVNFALALNRIKIVLVSNGDSYDDLANPNGNMQCILILNIFYLSYLLPYLHKNVA